MGNNTLLARIYQQVVQLFVALSARLREAFDRITPSVSWVMSRIITSSKKERIVVLTIIPIILICVVLTHSLWSRSVAFFTPTKSYEDVYTLVNDKVSKDGAIVINLPKGVSKEGANTRISFEPSIPGSWVQSTLGQSVIYRPNAALSVGKHYLVSLKMTEGTLSKDFLVDEDPAITAVFPDSSNEAPLSSAITIVFNRPMVPLTTLSELDSTYKPPVTISPATPGRFKWISTRTLQFIPTGTLYGSAHYKVDIGKGFVSMDGLEVPSGSYSFTTKQLRLLSDTSGTITYNQPIRFYFNQPVDLAKTLPTISLINSVSGSSIPSVVTYGTSHVWDQSTQKYVDLEDRSIIEVRPKNSLYGHANIWDFSTSYTASIATVYPVGGDITLSDSGNGTAVTTNITASDVIQNITIDSAHTQLASQDLFDPSATTTFSFYEDIDLSRSSINAKGLTHIGYGTKCAETDTDDDTCTKVDDQSQIIMQFDPSVYSRGEKIDITFKTLTNKGGYQVNKNPIIKTFTVYPALKILSTTPATDASKASISDLIICTNVPLETLDAKGFYDKFKASGYIVFGRYDEPYLLQTKGNSPDAASCPVGSYVNHIHYGLLPLHSYDLAFALNDVFGQSSQLNLSVTTEDAPKFYLKFQSLQDIYNVTTPDHTKLTYATENFDHVDVSVCKVSPESMVTLMAAQPSDISTKSNDSLPCVQTVERTIPLKPDQWVNQYFQLDLKDYYPDPRGQYILSFSNARYTDDKGMPLYARSYVSVTNLAVVDNHVNWSSSNYLLGGTPSVVPSDTRGAVFWVSGMGQLAQGPVPGASVAVYNTPSRYSNVPPSLVRSSTTNAQGLTEFPLISDFAGATISSGDDSAIISRWTDTLNGGWGSSASQEQRAYIYTDRPIYRPGQTVFIKGLYRVDFDGMYKIFKTDSVKLEITDSDGNTILTQWAPVNAFGTFSANITLPADAPLGTYSISGVDGYASFDVKEYVGAAFETKSTSDKDEYIAGDTAKIGVSGVYYFGVPLDGGKLDYTLTSQDYYFDRYTDQYFDFGSGWYDCYDCGYGDSYLKRGNTILDQNGTASVSIPLDFKTLFKNKTGDQSKIFVFHGTITDKQGKSVSFEKSFIVHRGTYYLGVKTDPYFVGAKQSFSLMAKTVDTQGKGVARSNITLTVNKVTWQSDKRQEVDSGYYYQSHRILTPVITRTVSTNGSGDFKEQDSLTDPGEYEIDAQGTDEHGNVIKSSTSLYVYGEGTVDVEPTNNATLDLTAEKKNVAVGETASFIIQNPYPHAQALISIERGRIFTYQVVDIDQSIYQYSFPISEDYVPNVFASVVLLGPGPAVKFGQIEYTVDTAKKALHIDVTTDKKSYLPGQQVNLTVSTKDSEGNPVPADVSLSVADLSVLALEGNPKKDPLVFFYGGFPLAISADTNVKNLLTETPIPTGTKGGGGGNPADLATHKRGEFKDTAYWQADVVTDNSGTASVSFKLPDNLTTWQIESLGITKDTKLGVNYDTIKAQKDVMLVPLVPRFVIPGDSFMIGAKIFNQTAAPQTLDISLTSPTLTLGDSGKTRKTIAPGDTTTVYFPAIAPLGMTDGAHTLTLSAKNSDYDDTVDQTLPITRNETYEAVATAGSSQDSQTTESIYIPDSVLMDRGGLTVRTSATLAIYLTDGLKYLFNYPYGCSEQISSTLSAIATAKRVLTVPHASDHFEIPQITFDQTQYSPDDAMRIGLNKLYATQNSDGGFAYYQGGNSDPYLTTTVLSSLFDIKDAGYKPTQSVIDNAIAYTKSHVADFQKSNNVDALIHISYVLTRAHTPDSSLNADIEQRVTRSYMNDTASSETLGYLALLASKGGMDNAFKDKVFTALINRVEIDSRGAYVRMSPENTSWQYYETSETDTALLIKALVADKRDYAEMDNLIRWLIASRAHDGSWGSTNATLTSINALTDYLLARHETESNFTLTTKLDSSTVSSTVFSADTIFTSISKFLPISSITSGLLHTVSFNKTNASDLPNPYYYDMSLKYYLPVDHIAPRDEGFAITRDFYSLIDTKNAQPLTSTHVGTVLRGVLTIVVPKEHHEFSVQDYIPAGFELVDYSLATEDSTNAQADSQGSQQGSDQGDGANSDTPQAVDTSTLVVQTQPLSLWDRILGLFGSKSQESIDTYTGALVGQTLYPDKVSLYDDRLFLFSEDITPGTYTYTYYVRATTPGTFNHLPAMASDLYYPEDFGRTSGETFTVQQ